MTKFILDEPCYLCVFVMLGLIWYNPGNNSVIYIVVIIIIIMIIAVMIV